MKNYYYYKAFRKTTIQFVDLFNDIQIARYDANGNFSKYVTVPLKYSPKEKIWYWLNERKDDIVLPIMSAALTGVEYNLERQTNKHKRVVQCSSPSAGTLDSYLNPIPYDLNFDLMIWSLYMHDIDQILEQILPYFTPYVYIRLYIPELSSSFQAKVLFQSATPEHESEYGEDGRRVLKYTLSFVVQTYLFKPIETTGLVGTIFTNFVLNDTDTVGYLDSTSTFTSGASGESMKIWGPSASDPDVWKYELYYVGNKIGKTLTFGD